jgi:hypothetical protein
MYCFRKKPQKKSVPFKDINFFSNLSQISVLTTGPSFAEIQAIALENPD